MGGQPAVRLTDQQRIPPCHGCLAISVGLLEPSQVTIELWGRNCQHPALRELAERVLYVENVLSVKRQAFKFSFQQVANQPKAKEE